MIITVNGVNLKADFSIETFVDIVEYKKRYEPHDKVSLTQYLTMVTDDERAIDTVVDILYYPHAYKMRVQGLAPILSWKDVAVHIAKNPNLASEVIADLVNSLPEGEEKKVKKKTTKVEI
jgi:hypothetical protein